MARQATTPVEFSRSVRRDTATLMTSGRAGKVVPVGYFPLLPGDSCSGRMGIDVQLAEMPKPLLNAVTANIQAWFVPKSAHPQFPGRDELMHAMTGDKIKALGAADRTPPPFFNLVNGAAIATVAASEFFKTLGLHIKTGDVINTDLLDAFTVIYNFRLAAHSSKLERRKYALEDLAQSVALPRAFWPSVHFANVVPDYERSLILGSMDLDVAAGTLRITGKAPVAGAAQIDNAFFNGGALVQGGTGQIAVVNSGKGIAFKRKSGNPTGTALDLNAVFNDLAVAVGNGGFAITTAQIDKARTTQAFAKIRTAYAGNDATGFDNDDTIVSLLMQGISVPADQFKRPWLLDSKRVPVGFAERFATDGANLDASVTTGRASAQLSLNVPVQDVGGVVIFTLEVLPERLHERMSDEWLYATDFSDLPNALRDIQRVEPVDLVTNRRVDAKHAKPNGLYGFEPMNDKWNRNFTRLGGSYYQATPGAPWREQRSAIWHKDLVNPTYSTTHYLAPADFPHDVFADTKGPAFDVVCRHLVTITGNTQIGDILAENNDDYAAVTEVME